MNLARQKSCLQIPADSKPVDWPEGWQFPPVEAWPPGYPKKFDGDVVLQCFYDIALNLLTVRCIDGYEEDTDEVLGQSFRVQGFENGKAVRMRSGDDAPWSEYGIFKIVPLSRNRFGIEIPISWEESRMNGSVLDVQIFLFGQEGCGSLMTVELN